MLTAAVGVVVPAHDEQALVGDCLAALAVAAGQPGLPPVHVVVVADSCRDATAQVAQAAGAEVIEVDERNAGAARARGFAFITKRSAVPVEALWLATTDADSRVPPGWLIRQLQRRQAGWDAVVGTVQIEDWAGHPPSTERRFAALYGRQRDDHPHVHGANLGLSAAAYLHVGGFPPLALAEDHALVAALERSGLLVARVGDVAVTTSARRDPRAAGGFGELLSALGAPLAQQPG